MKRLQQYLKDVIQELKKVTWLSKEELVASTSVVIAFAIAMGLFVWGVDFALSRVLNAIMN